MAGSGRPEPGEALKRVTLPPSLPVLSSPPTWASAWGRAPGNQRPRSAAPPPSPLGPGAPSLPRTPSSPPAPAPLLSTGPALAGGGLEPSLVDAVLGVTRRGGRRRRRLHGGGVLVAVALRDVGCVAAGWQGGQPARPRVQLGFRDAGGERHGRAGAGHVGAQAPGRLPRPRGSGGAATPRGRGGRRRPRNREHQ